MLNIGTTKALPRHKVARLLNSVAVSLTPSLCDDRSETSLCQKPGNIGPFPSSSIARKRCDLLITDLQFIEIKDGTATGEMQRTIRELLARQQAPKQARW